jgi:hypothetical protein
MENSSSILSNREKSIFECGIKLATVYHQFIGTPVSQKSKLSLEKAIEEAVKNQPYVEDVKVKINLEKSIDYISLNEKMLDVAVTTKYMNYRCTCRMKFQENINYPLMYIEKVEEI